MQPHSLVSYCFFCQQLPHDGDHLAADQLRSTAGECRCGDAPGAESGGAEPNPAGVQRDAHFADGALKRGERGIITRTATHRISLSLSDHFTITQEFRNFWFDNSTSPKIVKESWQWQHSPAFCLIIRSSHCAHHVLTSDPRHLCIYEYSHAFTRTLYMSHTFMPSTMGSATGRAGGHCPPKFKT